MQRLILTTLLIFGFISPKALACGSDGTNLNWKNEIIATKMSESVETDSCPTFEEVILTNERLERLIKENVLPSLQYFSQNSQKKGENRIVLSISDINYGKDSEKKIFKIDAYCNTDAAWCTNPDIENAYLSKTENASIFINDRTNGASKQISKTGRGISPETRLWKKYDFFYEDNPLISIRGYIYPDKLEIVDARSVVNFPFLTFY